MRFFKYLVFIFISIISVNTFAYISYYYNTGGPRFSTVEAACNHWFDNDSGFSRSSYTMTVSGNYCKVTDNYGYNYQPRIIYSEGSCPALGYPLPVYMPKGTTHVPVRLCKDGCTFTGGGRITETNNYDMTILGATGDSQNCTNQYQDDPPPKCDNKDPYGDCFVPPNDNCVRLKDGSITCPDNEPPPINQGCENGATYCIRPPAGCGEGYVSGSFNGQQLCVKSGPSSPTDPSDPTDPTDPQPPNQCTAQYCPKPEPEKDCPTGYYSSYHNGTPICVANNPNPNQPNQNDPNNNENASSEPVGGDDPNTTFDVKGIIDAIKALRDSLLGSLENISKKLTTLIDGQKTTNDHLTKLNEKSEKANEHLQNIQDSSSATSEAVGETNKKLDQIFSDQGKEQIEQLGEQSTDSRLTSAESEMTSNLQTFANTLSYSSSHACVSDFTVTDIPLYGSMTVPLSKWCDLLALVKLLLKLAVLMLALKIFYLTVRVF